MSLFGRRRREDAPTPAAAPAPDAPTRTASTTPSRGRRRRRSRAEGDRAQAQAAAAAPPVEEVASAPAPSQRARRRRRSTRTESAAEAPAAGRESAAKGRGAEGRGTAEAAPEAPPAEAPAPSRRRRRPKAEAPVEADMEAAVRAAAARARGQAGGLEGILARQGAVLEAYASEQLKVMQAVLRSLGALEARQVGPLSRAAAGQVPTALPRLGVFVDVPNIMYAAERRGVTIDWGRVLEYLSRGREVVRATAYAPISDDPTQRLSEQRFVQPFIGRGYRIVTKVLKRFADGSIKANFDVELAIDILTMSDRLDVVTLVSGDGDFLRLVELVASKGVRVEVVAFPESTAAELRAIADDYVDLDANLTEFRAV